MNWAEAGHLGAAEPDEQRCMQACLAEQHDLDAALATYNGARHSEVLALHRLDLTLRTRLGVGNAWHPLALAHRFHMVRHLSAWHALAPRSQPGRQAAIMP